MMTRTCAFSLVMAITSLPLLAAPQQSLGDLARQLQRERSKAGQKTTKVYTNDDFPARPASEGGGAASAAPSTPAATPSEQAQAERESGQPAKQTTQAPETGQAANQPENPEDKKKTREYWQARFKSARAQLADAQERQQLAEDELNLLQIQEIRALDRNVKSELAEKIKAKKDEVSRSRAAIEEARKALEALENEFQASGAPDEWSETEPGAPD
jgi:hypothetical protein